MGYDLRIHNNYPLEDCLSLFDEQFTIADFSYAIEKAERHSDSVISSTRTAVNKAFSGDQEDYSYVVDISDDLKGAIDSGDIKLVASADGEVFAQLRNANGHFGDRLPIKKELAEEGVSIEALQLALQMDAIKEQLNTMIGVLREIEGRVTDVIQGQHNDRIGLFYSGLSLFAEARDIKDEHLKRQIIAQALKSLSDANSQMIQEIRTSVEYLATEQYKHSKKPTERIEEHFTIIHQCYEVVYRASFLKASIYQESGEIASMLTAIDEYGRFVEKMIVPYTGKLSELDRHNKFIEKGTWGTIANTLVGCKELKQQICANNTYYLSMRE